jgi:UDP-glucose 4-epimerase
MKRVLITGAGSYIGTKVEEWLKRSPDLFEVDSVDTLNDNWKKADFTQYDVVYNVAGIAHVKAKKGEGPLYYAINRDMVIEIAKAAKAAGVKQFIHMSSMIVYKEVKKLSGKKINAGTLPSPNGFYGDSKLQGEIGIKELETPNFKVCILRPPMIYGPGCRGNFPKLVWLATKTPVFPAWHNKRSMLYIDNLCEFVKQVIINEVNGIVFPQNAEYADTCEIIRFYAKKYGHRIWITRLFNPLIWLSGNFLRPVGKMLSDSVYDMGMSKYDFEYQIVGLKDSFEKIEPRNSMR